MPIRLAQAIWILPDLDAPVRFYTSPGRLAPPPGRAIFSMLSKAAIGRNRSQRANLFQPDRHVTQIKSVDKTSIKEKIGTLSKRKMDEVYEGLKLVLTIPPQ